jgi:hypothetical protein
MILEEIQSALSATHLTRWQVQLRLHQIEQLKVLPFCGGPVCYEQAFEAHRSDSICVGAFDLY